jgi:hypothetical protein
MRSNGIRGFAALGAALSMVMLGTACRPTPPGGTTTTARPGPTTPTTPTTRPPTGGTPRFQSSDQWAQFTDSGYIVYNNIWGSGAGSQTLWANSYRNWGVRANHPNTGGVKSYPNASRTLDRRLSQVGTLTSSFNVTVPSSGAFTSAYDIWAGPTTAQNDRHDYEIMIWMNKVGPVGPIGGQEATANVGGHNFAVHRGSNGANAVFSFVRQGNVNSGTVDIKAILDWIRARGWFADVVVTDVQFGYEITSSAGNLAFTTNDYSVTAS